MSPRARLVLALVSALIPSLALGYWTLRTPTQGPPFDDSSIGQQLGGRVVGEVQVWSPEVLDIIRPERYLLRRYDAATRGEPIWTYVSFYRGVLQLGAGAHDPALCYPAQGWEVLDSQSIDIPMAGGTEVPATLMRALRGGQQQLVLYWIQPASRPPAPWAQEQVLRVADALSGQDQYAFVRLSTPLDQNLGSEEQLLDFARDLAPRVQQAVRSASLPGT